MYCACVVLCVLQDEIVSNHDELMCNFFAQADALAYGKSREELRAQNVPDYLIPHRSFTGATKPTTVCQQTNNSMLAGGRCMPPLFACCMGSACR